MDDPAIPSQPSVVPQPPFPPPPPLETPGIEVPEEPFLVPPRPATDQPVPPVISPLENPPPPPPLPPSPPPPPPSSPKRTPMKSVIIGLIAVFVIAGGALGYFLFQKGGMGIGEKAATEEGIAGKLVCMPIDDAGNITNEKYKYNRIKVINRTGKDVPVWIQDNFCDYVSQPSAGYQCNTYHNRWNDTVGNETSKIFPIDVPCNKTGQLDLARDNADGPACYNTADNREWQGGMAFTVKSNGTACPSSSCSGITYSINPPSPGANEPFSIFIDRSNATNCQGNWNDIGRRLNGGVCEEGIVNTGLTSYRLDYNNGLPGGTHTFALTVNTQGGVCSCVCNSFTFKVASSPTPTATPSSTPTVTPRLSVTPGPSPTPTVTPVVAACVSVAVEIAAGRDINNLQAGDTISFTASFRGAVEDVAVDLRKGGVSVKSFYAGGPKTNTWTTPSYTIGSAGSYEVMAFIKTNGVWK